MDDIPEPIVAGLSPSQLAVARAWWARLAEGDRAELAALMASEDRPPPGVRIRGGRFLADDEAAGWSEWIAAIIEDRTALPDPAFYEPPDFRRFHIG